MYGVSVRVNKKVCNRPGGTIMPAGSVGVVRLFWQQKMPGTSIQVTSAVSCCSAGRQ